MNVEMFDFKGHEVRVTVDEQGESRWVASDVAKVLGYREAKDMTRNLDSDEVSTEKVEAGRHQPPTSLVRRMNVITESGLYMAIIKSERPEARDFRRWVTREVLPSIRKHGGYISDGATEEQMEILQRELREKRDALDSAYSREDSIYGKWQKAQRELDSLKLLLGVRKELHGETNVFDFIFSRTEDYAFSAMWAIQLARDTGREWPYVLADRDGIFAIENDLRDAWIRYGYEAKFFAHKGEPFPSIKDLISGN